jgi:hypothetical protein
LACFTTSLNNSFMSILSHFSIQEIVNLIMPDIVDPACAGRHLDKFCFSSHFIGNHVR